MANRGTDKYIVHDSFPVGVEKGITRTFGNAGGGGNKEVAISYCFKNEIALFVCWGI